MSHYVRDAKFDVAIVAGPRVEIWPSAGVRALSSLCAEMGLTVGLFGGETINVRGVIPLPGTGGLVLAEDAQHRVHRIHARAVVRVNSILSLPDPFPGWRSQGLIPLSTAMRLRRESQVSWEPCTVVLGTGNRALRFASTLLESGVPQAYCVETHSQWGAKRFAGWEVERRRFEMAGGRLIEARPVKITPKSPLIWEFKLQDSLGIRVLDVARVVAAGPFRDLPAVREHPPGSFLFELEQTAAEYRSEDVEGWVMEEERGRWLAGKIVKTLVTDVGPKKETLDQIYRRARGRLKRYYRHREEPFTPGYQGKWIAVTDSRRIRTFKGAPQQQHKTRPIASIECFEEIPCNLCQIACPEDAIDIGKIPRNPEKILAESKCTACGLCLSACPSGTPVLVAEKEDRSMSQLTLPWRGKYVWVVGEFATLVNRRGESLGSARVLSVQPPGESTALHMSDKPSQLVQLEVPTHLIWEARSIKRGKVAPTVDQAYLASVAASSENTEKVEITFNGEKRLVRSELPVAMGLYETGQSRPEDVLFCPDGSCGLCQVEIDGVKKLACRTSIHRGMSIRIIESPAPTQGENALCPCLGITREQVIERMRQGTLKSPEAVISVTHVGEGKCHGQLCMDSLRRVMIEEGIDADQFIDWRFPWSEWILSPTSGSS